MYMQDLPHCKMKVLHKDEGTVRLIFDEDADKDKIFGASKEVIVKLSVIAPDNEETSV